MNEKSTTVETSTTANILNIFNIFWSCKYMILALALVAAIISYIKIQYFTPDVYSASGILYVLNRDERQRALDNDTAVYGSDITVSLAMTPTYIEILNTRAFYENVSASLGGAYSASQVKSMFTITPRNDTALLDVSVRCNTAEGASAVANAILYEAPKKLVEVFDSGEVKVVEWAATPTSPRGKDMTRHVMISFLAGLLLGCAIAFIRDFLDNTIHRSDDVAKKYGVYILGEISQ